MALLFDGYNKRIILDTTSITTQRIWSEWVDWAVNNNNWSLALSQVGGDDLGGGLLIPFYFFLLNGWRVRPMESNQNLTITGNLFVDGGGTPVVSTLGTYQVNVNYTVPVQAQGISTSGSSGLTAQQVTEAVLNALLDNYNMEGSLSDILSKTYHTSKNTYIQNL